MAKPVASRGTDQFVLRLPDGMRDQIKQSAEKNGRSMNSEIIHMVEFALNGELSADSESALKKIIKEQTGQNADDYRFDYIKTMMKSVNQTNQELLKLLISKTYLNGVEDPLVGFSKNTETNIKEK